MGRLADKVSAHRSSATVCKPSSNSLPFLPPCLSSFPPPSFLSSLFLSSLLSLLSPFSLPSYLSSLLSLLSLSLLSPFSPPSFLSSFLSLHPPFPPLFPLFMSRVPEQPTPQVDLTGSVFVDTPDTVRETQCSVYNSSLDVRFKGQSGHFTNVFPNLIPMPQASLTVKIS